MIAIERTIVGNYDYLLSPVRAGERLCGELLEEGETSFALKIGGLKSYEIITYYRGRADLAGGGKRPECDRPLDRKFLHGRQRAPNRSSAQPERWPSDRVY